MLPWLCSGIGGEKDGKYCVVGGSVSSDIWGGAVVYTGIVEAPDARSARVTGGE